MASTTNEWQGILTNSCTCQTYDADTDTLTDATECYGDCWDDELYVFKHDLGDWFTNNIEGWWQVNGLPLWNGGISGVFQAMPDNDSPTVGAGGSVAKVVSFTDTLHDIADFVRGITVNGEWVLRYRLHGETMVASLSHHDVPMGRQFTVTYGTKPPHRP
jgi:hypothetical protein